MIDLLQKATPQLEPDARDRIAKRVFKTKTQRPMLRLALACMMIFLVGFSVASIGNVNDLSNKTSRSENPLAGMTGDEERSSSESKVAAPSEPSIGQAIIAPCYDCGGDVDIQDPNRKVQRSASIGIQTKDVAKASSRVTEIVSLSGGIVSSLNQSITDGQSQANISLMVPSEKAAETMTKLSQIGETKSRSESAYDITGSFNQSKDELDQAKAERKGLLAELSKASTAGQRRDVQALLESNRIRIQNADQSMQGLERQTKYSQIDVTIAQEFDDNSASEDEWSIGKAFEQAAKVLAFMLGIFIVGLAALAPFILIALIWRAIRK